MLNYPFFLANGWMPYRDWSSVYTPFFLYFLKFFYDIFGYTISSYQLLVILIFAVTSLLVFRITKSFIALSFFAVAYFAFGGNAVWFEMFLAPFILTMYLLNNSTLISLLFSICVLSKQTAFYLLPLVINDLIKKPVPFLLLVIIFVVYLIVNNLIFDFYRWGIEFVFFLPKAGDISFPTLKQGLVVLTFIFPLIILKNPKTAKFSFFTLLFAFPRFEFFHLIPFLTIFTVAVSKKPFLFLVPLIPTLLLFKTTLNLGNRFIEPSVLEIASDLQKADKSIFSLNGPDQIYFLTNKMPAVRPWVDQLPWQLKFVKEEFYESFIAARPDIIITKPYLAEPVQGLGAYKPENVWKFVSNNYHLVKTYGDNTQILERN